MNERAVRIAALAVLGAMVAGAGGCKGSRTSSRDAWRLERDGYALEVLGSVDRVTYFGPRKGPNVLLSKRLNEEPEIEGDYVFRGGVYSWVSPQDAPMGWVDPLGDLRVWPPDPAMDVGPVRRTASASHELEMTGPVQLRGVREIKRVRLLPGGEAEHEFRIENERDFEVVAGPWLLSAAERRDVIAVRMPEGSEVWAREAEWVDRLMEIATEPDERGWVLVNLSRARWEGAIKVFVNPPEGVPVELAVRREGFWHFRSLGVMDAGDVTRLKEVGEGPLALHIQPGRERGVETIIEAELYGPISTIAPGARSEPSVERWRLIKARGRKLDVLPD